MQCKTCSSELKLARTDTLICDVCETVTDTDIIVKSILEWSKEIHENAVAHGWWEEGNRNIGEQIALMHSELSEALEEWRKNKDLETVYYNVELGTVSSKPEGFGVELADCVIRIMDTCFKCGIDLEEMIALKHKYNLTRPYRHGGKLA